MIDECDPVGIPADAVTFRYESPDDEPDLLFIDYDTGRKPRRTLTLTEEQARVLREHTVEAKHERLAPIVDREDVGFGVVFSFDPPPGRCHDRAAVYEYGKGELHVSVCDGESFRMWAGPALAQDLYRLTR